MTESQCAALANLEMIILAATGEYVPKPGELLKRKGALTAFIVSGQCFPTDSYRQLAAKVNEVVTSHLNQPEGVGGD